MALNFIRRRIQRSIFEAIRLVLVNEGYLPDITNYTDDQAGQNQFNLDLKDIAESALGFAIELFGNSSNQYKGLKKTPRITIHINRSIPGDIGFDVYSGKFQRNPEDPDKYIKITPPFDTSNIQLDIRLVSSSSEQDIITEAILQNAIGVRKFLPLYDDPGQVFFIRQYDYFDVPDTPEGILEKVYSYQVDDLILSEESKVEVPLINEITLKTTIADLEAMLTKSGNIIGPYVDGDDLVINLSGIKFKV